VGIESVVKADELVSNKDRKFGSADEYFPCFLEKDGEKIPMLFTHSDIQVAVERAQKNPEDISTNDADEGGFFHRIFG